MKSSPEAVTALMIGTLIGVCFFRGLAVGPLIAGSVVALVLGLLKPEPPSRHRLAATQYLFCQKIAGGRLERALRARSDFHLADIRQAILLRLATQSFRQATQRQRQRQARPPPC
jgi:hypothetical protein